MKNTKQLLTSNASYVLAAISLTAMSACNSSEERVMIGESAAQPTTTGAPDQGGELPGNTDAEGGEADGGADAPEPSASSGGSDSSQQPTPADPTDQGGDSDDSDEGGDEADIPRFDVPSRSAEDEDCLGKEAGIHCKGYTASFQCDEKGHRVGYEDCRPDFCAEGIGCAICWEGQFSCQGDRVMKCDTSVEGHRWEEIAQCNTPSEVCKVKTGTCEPTEVIGEKEPTGTYYQYAIFKNGHIPELTGGGGGIASFENRIYTVVGGAVRVFEVELLDSDGDGELEPNQHPDNPDKPGEIEERVLTYVEDIDIGDNPQGGGSGELYVTGEAIFYERGNELFQYDMATGSKTEIAPTPFNGIAFHGYDEINDIWYAGSEGARAVKQYDARTDSWGWAFHYPDLAGSHMDGMEVVAQKKVDSEGRISWGTPYVYVSDMTSDFIGQYRLDPVEGWVQENLFEYHDQTGGVVESLGFGALNHFWANGSSFIYELGGGDLAKYTEPVQ